MFCLYFVTDKGILRQACDRTGPMLWQIYVLFIFCDR